MGQRAENNSPIEIHTREEERGGRSVKQKETDPANRVVTNRNHQLPLYCSPVPDPGAWSTDTPVIPWDSLWAYAFPPQALITQVLTN